MEIVTPILAPEFQGGEVVYAENQPEYNKLPVIRNQDGVVLSRWRLSQLERNAITDGADVYLYVHTFNHPLQPVRLEVGECDRSAMDKAEYMGLLENRLIRA